MALIYHNITPPEYFVGVHRTLARQCFRGRRELQAYVDRCDLALGDSEFNRQDLEALGFPRTAVLPVVPDFSHLDRAPNWLVAREFDDDWTNILFVGRVIANKKIEDLIRFFHAYHTVFNPRSRLLIVGAHSGFERYLAALHHLVGDARHLARPLRRPRLRRGAGRLLRRRRSLSLRQRARRLLRAARRGVLQAGAGARLRRDGGAGDDGRRRRAVRRQGSAARRGADGRDPVGRGAAGRIVDGQLAAVDRLRAKDFAGTLLGFVDAILVAAARAAADGRLRFLGAVRRRAGARRAPAVSPGDLQGAAASRAEPDDRQPVGAGGAPGRRDRRQRAARARSAARRWATSPSSTR